MHTQLEAQMVGFLPLMFTVTVTADTAATAVWEDAPVVINTGVTGSFNDRIKLNCYFSFPAEVLADEGAYVTLTNETAGQASTLPVADTAFVEGKGYKSSIPMAAKEAGGRITAKVFGSQGGQFWILGASSTDYTGAGVPYSLMQYFTRLENNGTGTDKAMGAAARDYCSAAAICFDYNADGLSVGCAVDAVTADTLSSYVAGREGTLPAGVSIRGISASVLTYARSCVIKTDEKEINLGKTLYLYNKAAVAAFGN